MTHASLCSGIGGFELAAQWAGIETLFNCEIDPFCRKVLKKHFPDSVQYEDLTTTDFSPWRGKINILSAGFPCQPFSLAGLRKGTADYRAIWPSVLRVIREVKPAYVIGENVTGLINMALDEVLTSLEAEGYTAEVFVLPACGVGAPHRRDRVWIIAYAANNRQGRQSRGSAAGEEWRMVPQRLRPGSEPERGSQTSANSACELSHRGGCSRHWGCQPSDGCKEFNANPNHQRREELHTPGVAAVPGRDGRSDSEGRVRGAAFRLTEPPVCGSDDGLPTGLVRNRSHQLKAYGNAIVPQVAYELFKAIIQLDQAS